MLFSLKKKKGDKNRGPVAFHVTRAHYLAPHSRRESWRPHVLTRNVEYDEHVSIEALRVHQRGVILCVAFYTESVVFFSLRLPCIYIYVWVQSSFHIMRHRVIGLAGAPRPALFHLDLPSKSIRQACGVRFRQSEPENHHNMEKTSNKTKTSRFVFVSFQILCCS